MNVKSIRWSLGGRATTTSPDALSRSFVTNIGYRLLDNSGVNDSADIVTFALIAKVAETTNNIVIEDIKTSTLDRGLSMYNIGVSTHNGSPWGQVETESIPSNTLPSTALQFSGDLYGVLGFPTSFPTSTHLTESLSIDKAFDILEEILIASGSATPIGVSEDSSVLLANVTSVCKVANNVINFTFNQVNGVTFTSAIDYGQGPAIATVCQNMFMANKMSPSSFVDDFNSRSNLSDSINNDSIAKSIIYEKLSHLNTVVDDFNSRSNLSRSINNDSIAKSISYEKLSNLSTVVDDFNSRSNLSYSINNNSIAKSIIYEKPSHLNTVTQDIFLICQIVNPGDEKSSTADTQGTLLNNNSSNAPERSSKGDTEGIHDLPTNSVITNILDHEIWSNVNSDPQNVFRNFNMNNNVKNGSRGSDGDNDQANQSSKKYSYDDDDNHISQGSNNLDENNMYDINDSPINVAISDIIDNETDINFDNILQDDFLNPGVNNDIENKSYNNDNSHMNQGLKSGSRDNGNDDYDDQYMNQDSKISGESNIYNTHDLPINVEAVDIVDYGTHLTLMNTFLSTPDH